MKLLRLLLPILVVATSIGIAVLLFATEPEAKRHSKPRALPVVETIPLEQADHPRTLHSQGTVSARTQTTLVAEVSGKILEISPQFRSGSFFSKGDIFLRIDPRNYENAVTVAEADLALKQVELEKEMALAEQAQRNWERLGEGDTPTDLVLRKPQLAAAKAALGAARARLKQARTDLERTVIHAPYEGRVLEQQADIGQFVTLGTPLGTVFATDLLEIRLPLSNAQLDELDIPPRYATRHSQTEENAAGETPSVTVYIPNDGEKPTHNWQGKIVRVSAALDPKTRQPFVVAQVDHPYEPAGGLLRPLKIGQFVEAEIVGKTINGAYKIPTAALVNKQILTVDSHNLIHKVNVSEIAREPGFYLVTGPIPPGQRLVTTSLPLATEGMQVAIKGEEAPFKEIKAEPAQAGVRHE